MSELAYAFLSDEKTVTRSDTRASTPQVQAAHTRLQADRAAWVVARARLDAADLAFEQALDDRVTTQELREFDEELHAATVAHHAADAAGRSSAQLLLCALNQAVARNP